MKRKNILYVIISILFLIAIYFITVAQVLIEKQDEFNESVYKEARETKNFDKFIAVQVNKYLLIDEVVVEKYKMSLYQITENSNEQKIVIIIVPLVEVKYARDAKDLNDKSRLTTYSIDNDKWLLNTADFDAAISYGYDKDKIGFMFFSFEIKQNDLLSIKYYDYENQLMIDYERNFKYKNSEEINDEFKNGYKIEEIKNEMNYNKFLKNKLIIRITVYLALIILIPYIYKLIKYLIIKPNNKRGKI